MSYLPPQIFEGYRSKPPREDEENKNKKLLVLFIIIFLILVGGWFFYIHNKEKALNKQLQKEYSSINLPKEGQIDFNNLSIQEKRELLKLIQKLRELQEKEEALIKELTKTPGNKDKEEELMRIERELVEIKKALKIKYDRNEETLRLLYIDRSIEELPEKKLVIKTKDLEKEGRILCKDDRNYSFCSLFTINLSPLNSSKGSLK